MSIRRQGRAESTAAPEGPWWHGGWKQTKWSMTCKANSTYPLLFHVSLVSDQHAVHIAAGVLLNVAQPLGDVLERSLVRDVVNEQDAHGVSVVRWTHQKRL